jgi:hypothetical protein
MGVVVPIVPDEALGGLDEEDDAVVVAALPREGGLSGAGAGARAEFVSCGDDDGAPPAPRRTEAQISLEATAGSTVERLFGDVIFCRAVDEDTAACCASLAAFVDTSRDPLRTISALISSSAFVDTFPPRDV